MSNTNITFARAGDSALFCRISDRICLESSQYVISLHKLILDRKLTGLIESVPSYTGLMLYFNPLKTRPEAVEKSISALYSELRSGKAAFNGRILKIPVCYDRSYAPDIDFVSESSGLNYKDVIELHTSAEYFVNMVGFTPGFPYMGGMNKKLNTARKNEPRLKIKAGSVGIAGDQTGIYPIESPGGWQIIGRTPLRLYNKDKSDPFLVRAGDRIKLRSISLTEYFQIGENVRLGKYKPEIIADYERSEDN